MAAPARAAVTLVEGDKGKLDVEFRLMVWATDTGPDLPLLPGLNTAPPPAQEVLLTEIRDILKARA